MLLKDAILKVIPNAPIDALFTCFRDYNITDMECQVNIVAQLAHESGNFRRCSENLNYSAQGLANTWPSRFRNKDRTPNALALSIARKPELIANHVYSNRMGNGDFNSGDGWKYRGAGYIQLTGKHQFKTVGVFLKNKDIIEDENLYINSPEILRTSPHNLISAFGYLASRNILNEKDFYLMTKKINGGYIGIEERLRIRNSILNLIKS